MTLDNNTSLSQITEQQITEFAREQSRYYLDRAQMTYWEKLQDKADRTRNKASLKLNRFKLRSAQSEESQADLTAYMIDFVADLVSQGASEEEAFDRARKELAHDSGSALADDLYELYSQQYFDPADGYPRAQAADL
ncbi:MAG: hypothetical protein FWD45_06110, partial [Coriobacteriia bacterium]|nr:hypothetical protein [Coriobacteriia bacterium]